MASESKVGKRKWDGFLVRLRELAVYRISEAGFTHRQGLKMLDGVCKIFNIKPYSAANWEHAQARTRKRIAEVKRLHEFAAWDQGQGSPDNWRDYFVKPFGGFGL